MVTMKEELNAQKNWSHNFHSNHKMHREKSEYNVPPLWGCYKIWHWPSYE